MNSATKNDIDLSHNFEAFKSLVTQHVTQKMTTIEFNRYREMSINSKRSLHPDLKANVSLTLTELLDESISEDSLSVNEITKAMQKHGLDVIGEIDGEAVYFVNGQGIYLWGKSPESLPVITVWLTYPAYPPNW